MSRRIKPEVWAEYVDLRLAGKTRSAAARALSISYVTAQTFDRGEPSSSGHDIWRRLCAGRYPFSVEAAEHGPVEDNYRTHSEVETKCEEAKLALDDFELFRRRYLGEVSRPWHLKTYESVREGLLEQGRSFRIINAPPGTGKSTLIRAIGLSETVRNRAIRCARLSSVLALAKGEVRLIRRHLERTTPVSQRADLVRAGLAVDAVSTLERDYGRFRPEGRDLWSTEQFVVAQPGGELVSEKEPTWSAYGWDSAIIGWRFELLLGDDLDTPSTIRASEEVRRSRETDWNDEIETRLEGDGLIVVLGQRLSKRDIYRFLLDKRISVDDGEVLDLTRNPDGRKYTQIVFPAHDDTVCQKLHGRDAPALGEGGCLLDPYRQPWRDLLSIRESNPETYATVYQQLDGTSTTDLIEPQWIEGGVDKFGILAPGCWDHERRLWQVPMHARRRGIGVIQVDPSGSAHWAIQAWVYDPPVISEDDSSIDVSDAATLGHIRYLVDVFDGEMPADDLLDYSLDLKLHRGKLEEWRNNFRAMGVKLRYVVLEVNAAQRYLLQFEHARTWARMHQIQYVPHTTGVLKTDEKLGIYALKSPYRHGMVRLPGGDLLSRAACTPLVHQLTNWPGRRTDQAMANWFGEFNLRKFYPEEIDDDRSGKFRPTWLLKGVPA